MTQGMTSLSRQAMIDMLVPVVAQEPTASLTRMAGLLGVGRTTLYRHFTDRQSLLRAVAAEAARRFVEATVRADPLRGTGAEALERMCGELFGLPDVLTMLFADNPLVTDDDLSAAARHMVSEGNDMPIGTPHADDESDHDPFLAVITRGQLDGSIVDTVPAGWAGMYAFLTMASGHLYAIASGASRSESLEFVMRAVRQTLFSLPQPN